MAEAGRQAGLTGRGAPGGQGAAGSRRAHALLHCSSAESCGTTWHKAQNWHSTPQPVSTLTAEPIMVKRSTR